MATLIKVSWIVPNNKMKKFAELLGEIKRLLEEDIPPITSKPAKRKTKLNT